MPPSSHTSPQADIQYVYGTWVYSGYYVLGYQPTVVIACAFCMLLGTILIINVYAKKTLLLWNATDSNLI